MKNVWLKKRNFFEGLEIVIFNDQELNCIYATKLYQPETWWNFAYGITIYGYGLRKNQEIIKKCVFTYPIHIGNGDTLRMSYTINIEGAI